MARKETASRPSANIVDGFNAVDSWHRGGLFGAVVFCALSFFLPGEDIVP